MSEINFDTQHIEITTKNKIQETMVYIDQIMRKCPYQKGDDHENKKEKTRMKNEE